MWRKIETKAGFKYIIHFLKNLAMLLKGKGLIEWKAAIEAGKIAEIA